MHQTFLGFPSIRIIIRVWLNMHQRHHKRHHRGKNQNAQIKGRHIPKMLAEARQSQSTNHAGKSKYRPSPSIEVDGVTWQALLLLLIVCPTVVAQTGVFDHLSSRSVHDYPLVELPTTANCWQKRQGISSGRICQIGAVTYFLKSLQERSSMHERNAVPGKPGLVTYEEFNRQFVRQNIGARAPETRFFQVAERHGDGKLYIASKKVDGLKFSGAVKPQDMARYAVAATFISDLHNSNYGYQDDALVLIDVDSVNNIPAGVLGYLNLALESFGWRVDSMTLQNFIEMKSIYEKMQSTPLPKFHDDFQLTYEVYQEVLRIYIKACDDVITYGNKLRLSLGVNKPFLVLNQVWTESVRHARDEIVNQKNAQGKGVHAGQGWCNILSGRTG